MKKEIYKTKIYLFDYVNGSLRFNHCKESNTKKNKRKGGNLQKKGLVIKIGN